MGLAVAVIGALLVSVGAGAPPASAAIDPTLCSQLTAKGAAATGRPNADAAWFNTPVSCLNLHPQTTAWSNRWYMNGNLRSYCSNLTAAPAITLPLPGQSTNPCTNNNLPAYRGDIDLSFRDFSSPVYTATTSTPNRRFFISKNVSMYNPLTGPYLTGVPFDYSWKASNGSDKEMVFIRPSDGKEWLVWGLLDPNDAFNGCNGFAYWFQFTPSDVCVWGVWEGRKVTYTVGNYLTDNGFRDGLSILPTTGNGNTLDVSRGAGRFNGLTLVPTLAEVQAAVGELQTDISQSGQIANGTVNGYIHHALNMETFNTWFGSTPDNDPNNPSADISCAGAMSGTTKLWGGTTPAGTPLATANAAGSNSCAFAVSPATRVEHRDPHGRMTAIPNSDTGRSRMVPEGMRFRIKRCPTAGSSSCTTADSDAALKTWLTGRGFTVNSPRFLTAFVFARTLRE